MKTPERAHMPAKLWEKVKLSKNYPQALKQLNENLEFWPGHLVKKCKQRLTRLTQSLIRSRKLAKKEEYAFLYHVRIYKRNISQFTPFFFPPFFFFFFFLLSRSLFHSHCLFIKRYFANNILNTFIICFLKLFIHSFIFDLL